MAVLHLAGLSTRTLSMLSNRVLRVEVSPQTVTNSLAVIEPQALAWLERELTKPYWALYVDGTNFRVQRRGSTEKEPSLVVLGVDADNHMSLLAIEPGTKENVGAWESAFASLIKRGLDPSAVRIGVMDGLPGLENLFRLTFPNAVTGRCWVHALKNAINKCPARLREIFKKGAHKVMYATSENSARVAFAELKTVMGSDAERAVRCLEKDLESLLTHYRFEKKFWRVLKTTNPIERVNKEFKRRTKSMETVGEKTLEKVLAFTALKLEFNWSRFTVDAPYLENFHSYRLRQQGTTNQIESAVGSLIH
jgi:putative transposase